MSGDVYEWNPPRQGELAEAVADLELAVLKYWGNRPGPGEPDPVIVELVAACERVLFHSGEALE